MTQRQRLKYKIRKQNRVKQHWSVHKVSYFHLVPVAMLVLVLAGTDAGLTGATRLLVDLSKAA